MSTPRTNAVILSSIPLNKHLKRYWISKYERISRNCGYSEACRKFKALRVAILTYLSDENRRSNLDTYVAMAGFRANGQLRRLFEYAETQPHFVLNFLKLYTAKQPQSATSIDAAAGECKRRLEQVKVNTSVPKVLKAWFSLVVRRGAGYNKIKGNPSHPMHRCAKLHSAQEWYAYWRKWERILVKGWKSSVKLDYKHVFPEVYKDWRGHDEGSASYKQDLGDLFSMHLVEEGCPLTYDQLNFVDGYLNEDVQDVLQAFLWGETQGAEDLFSDCGLLSGLYVGHVQHIRKKGAGNELRDIAVPNRFIQNALVAVADRMYNLVRELPRDATFDQDRFDRLIQGRVNNLCLYQGSVDLSKATDNLPREWGEYIIDQLQTYFHPTQMRAGAKSERTLVSDERLLKEREEEFCRSYDLFKTVSGAKWEDEGYLLAWEVGQPLGSLPSFADLAITHDFYLEANACALALLHSPYVALGDDVVIFNKKLRRRYIRDLVSRGIPLSLHKSYSGRLSEFAGKTYIRANVPFYTSDHNPVTWESLFDWQRSTGIRIPWTNLPRRIRRRACSLAKNHCEEGFPQTKVEQLASAAYGLVLTCEIPGRGTHLYPIRDSAKMSERIARFFENIETSDLSPDPQYHTGITMIGSGHPVVLLGQRLMEKNGYFHRFRPVELPPWYRAKFRPCATDAAFNAAIAATL